MPGFIINFLFGYIWMGCFLGLEEIYCFIGFLLCFGERTKLRV